MCGRLAGKVALITGGGTGIGSSIARRFASNGASIIIMGRRSEHLQKIAKETDGLAMQGDVQKSEDLYTAVSEAVKKFGGLDIVVANAGISIKSDVANVKDDDWQKVIDINLTGVMRTARAALPVLIDRGGGSIVNVSSVAGLFGYAGGAPYIASKTAVLGLTRSMAFDYGPHGIRVNTLCPGWTKTSMAEEDMLPLMKKKDISIEEAFLEVTRFLPLKRMAMPEEIASCAEFLASDDASFVTGTIMIADGGGSIVDVGALPFSI